MKFSLLRFTNSFLLGAVLLLTLTGVYGLFWTLAGWMFDIHRFAGWVLVALLPWKAAIAVRSLRRGMQPDFDRGVLIAVSLLLAAATLLVLALGFSWSWRFAPESLWLRQTAISWHWMLALGLLAPLALHVWRRWPRPKKIDFTSRRAALKIVGLGGAALAAWWASQRTAAWREQEEAPRRFTGSRLEGLFSGNQFPVTHSRGIEEGTIDISQWRLELDGRVDRPQAFSYPALQALLQSERNATLDCTLGWYTTQQWRGVALLDLLEEAGAAAAALGVRLESLTGYAHFLPMEEARDVLLATHVGEEALSHWHGAPLRAVVPSRRGWFWVKWLSRVEVL